MIQNVLRDIGGIGIYGVISVCLFFTVFGGALLWACTQRKSFLKRMSNLPLEEDNSRATTKGDCRYE
jgi:cytochrome c oxidase cbb3-type subunit 4